MKTLKTVCIMCPNGCHLTVTETAKGVVVTGNKCPRGAEYGAAELTDPKRVLTCVVRTTSDRHRCVSVKTTEAVSKKRLPGLLNKLYKLRVELPVTRGETALKDKDITVVYTRSISQ